MSFYIKEYDSGLKEVMFNTRDKWMDYDILYGMGVNESLSVTLDTFEEQTNLEGKYRHFVESVTVPLPDTFKGCIKYVMQEKDQIEILFVPKEMFL